MLKSHFNLVNNTLPMPEEEHEVEVVTPIDDTIPERNLHRSEISVRLNLIGKTADGDGYTYLKATLTGLKLTNIVAIKHFIHLQFVDVSNNYLDLQALQVLAELPNLIVLQADNNRLTSAALKQMKYLQVIIMNENQITSVEDVFQEHLSTLEVGHNQIEKIYFKTEMNTIRVLDFRHNLLTDIQGLNYPLLDSLYIAGNKITSLVGIENLVNLRLLHARNNPIKILNGFNESLTKLIYINLRNCKVAALKQVKKLKVLKNLEILVLKGCPIMISDEDAEIRIEVLAALPRLKRINKEDVSPEEREEAKELMMQGVDDSDKHEEEEEELEPQVDEETHEEE